MIFLILATLAAQAAPSTPGITRSDDLAVRKAARARTLPVFQNAMTQWRACLVPQAKRLAASRDTPDGVANAALAACSKWEKPIKAGLPTQMALNNNNMPFPAAMKFANNLVEDSFNMLRSGVKNQITSIVVTHRSAARTKS
jgi:hypothetical protein